MSFVDIGFAHVDTDRKRRCGVPEVIFCQGKTASEIVAITKTLYAHSGQVLGTRISPEQFKRVGRAFPKARYHERARCFTLIKKRLPRMTHTIGLLCAGTSDLPVAEEAAVTMDILGCKIDKIYDVGVAGIHRLLAHRERLESCSVLVVVAGMEGALPSAVAGLVSKPIIAVPTSVGYGASFGGLSALLGMLNSCGSGVTVVNIDNGFGAGYAAASICRVAEPK